MSKNKNVPSPTPANETWYATNSGGVSMLEGKLLTLLDATISDPEQRKALKDILRQTVWNWALSETCRVEYEDVKFVHYNDKGMQDGYRKNPALKTKGE